MEPTRFADELGPYQTLHLHLPRVGLKATVVVDNVACGPAVGGVRMAPDVTTEECFRLARAMTYKNAAAGLPHGGGKSVISADPRMPLERKEQLLRAFATAIRNLTDYIPGPDMGTDEQCMGWIRDEIGRAVGLPEVLGGIPIDVLGATGFGVASAIDEARAFIGLELTEYHGGTRQEAFRAVDEKIRHNTRLVVEEARRAGVLPRQAAISLAERRVREAMRSRRWGQVGSR